MNDQEIMDQTKLAEDVAEKIKYKFLDYFLVKPLDPIKVKKEFSKPVSTGTPSKDADGIEAQDYDTVETEVKEVDSDFRKGVVIKRPMYYDVEDDEHQRDIHVGDIVIFKDTTGIRFDLVKDSRLIRLYEILGIEK